MRRGATTTTFACVLGLAFAVSGCARPAVPPSKVEDASAKLEAIFAAEWNHTQLKHPVWASRFGDPRRPDRWGDVGLAEQNRREAHMREVLAKLDAIPRSQLEGQRLLSYDLFRFDYETAIAGQPFRPWLLESNQRGGIQTSDELAATLTFAGAKDFADWNGRLRDFSRYMDETIELLNEGARTGITHPKIVMERVLPQIERQIAVDPTKSPFYAPYLRPIPSGVPAAEHERLAAEAKQAIATSVVPSFEKFRTFWTTIYLPACKDDVGAWRLPNGPAFYAYAVRSYTTTNLGPDEIHAIGLREVARIRGEMEAAKAKAGFKGSLKDLFQFLRSEPRFHFEDGASLLVAYRDLAKRIDPLLSTMFKKLPRTPYGVAPIPDNVAPDTTTAYYLQPAFDGSRAATFMVNLYKPESRPKWEMAALTLHEAVPGHHLQTAVALEEQDLPDFRRNGDYTAFVEGWALYAESLGDEMGIYDDPYSKIGQLIYEMWRAARLVVDTGIHHLKWDRQRAIDFLRENTAKSDLDIVNEVDRYIAWPGQALAYKLGELEIKRLRREERAALGARFDIKDFHDRVLRNGPLPLELLSREVTRGRPR
jgi:uncharacterized protein (DUF885 family)